MPITDLTGYTWVGNDNPSYSNDFTYSINFTSNNTNYTSITCNLFSQGYQLKYNNTGIYGWDFGWSNNAYKTIQITGGTDVTNSNLISWLEANGTLTAPQPQQTDKIFIGNTALSKAFVGNSEVSSIWLGDVKLYEKSAPQPTGWTFGVSGLSSSTPALTRTDDSANFTWTKNSSTGIITSDFDQYFNFERVVHSGSIFVRIPKMYFKRTADTIQLSNHAQTGFSVHPAFLDESGNENDYYDVGCYKAYNDNNVMKSVSGVSTPGYVSLTNWRTYARANNTGSDRQYFVEDIRYLSLLWMLWMVVFATRQTETVMGTSWYSYSGATTGNTDSLVNNDLTYPMSICGQDPTTHSFKFFGIEDVVSAGREWIDGVAFVDTTIKFSLKPSEYVSSTFTNYIDLSYARPTDNNNIKVMGLDSNHPAIMYPNETTGTTDYTTYYCDRVYYSSGTKALFFGADDFRASYGVFYCNGYSDFSSASDSIRSRLCSQPL